MREFRIHSTGIEATIVPERGGLITQLAIEGTELLFLDRATFEDRSEHVRGGIPILFPFAAHLDDGILKATGKPMPLHGFARDLEWTTDEEEERSPNSHCMWLEPDEKTLEPYPFPLRLTQTTRVVERQLSVTLDIENKGDAPMPMAPGWHPYFCCPEKGKKAVTYEIEEGFPYDELSTEEIYDIGLEAPRATQIHFDIPNVSKVRLAFSPDFRHLQFWSLPGREFICVEPWDGPANVINTEDCRCIEPGEAATYWMGISLAGKD